MPINRREMLGAASSAFVLSGICGSTSFTATTPATIKAIAFDGFPIFDPRPIFALAEGDQFLKRVGLYLAFSEQQLRVAGNHRDRFEVLQQIIRQRDDCAVQNGLVRTPRGHADPL